MELFAYLLVLIGMIICFGASALVDSRMAKYRSAPASNHKTGAEVAREILDRQGLYYVSVECVDENIGSHYDPKAQAVRLSYQDYNRSSITATAVAAHECGHAIQHAEQYQILEFRSAWVPVVNFASKAGTPLIVAGIILGYFQPLIWLGILAFSAALIFQLVTLPVEFNASARAIDKIREYELLNSIELSNGKKVLTAAAFTYVAAALAAALSVLRLVLVYGGLGGRNNRRSGRR